MRDFTVAAGELDLASGCLSDRAHNLAGVQLEDPDNSMYGPLVAAAVNDAEPAATSDMNALIARVSWMIDVLAERTKDTGRRYAEAEQGNAELCRGISPVAGNGGQA